MHDIWDGLPFRVLETAKGGAECIATVAAVRDMMAGWAVYKHLVEQFPKCEFELKQGIRIMARSYEPKPFPIRL